MNNDFIKIYRKLQEWEWYKDVNTFKLFIHMLLKANWKPGRFKGVIIERGELATSLQSLSAESGLSIQQVRTAIKHLNLTGELTQNQHSTFTVFTVVNYDLYQGTNTDINTESTGNQQGTNIVLTQNQQGTNRGLTTIEEKKKGRKEEKKEGKKGRKEEKKYKYITDNQHIQIIDFLNRKCGTNYRPTTDSTKQLINARLADGYTVDDFYTVIEKKWQEWAGTEWEQYMRPSTLFGTKFECYLNQNIVETKKNDSNNRQNTYNSEFLAGVLERHEMREAIKKGELKEYDI